ncbi:hypothetical protein B0H13DRAFT_2667371 [Mycena leptocephala]|nr:hypothetical protein B0H13DRAFT_2667371 [Mycena leptocephala]
MGLPPHAWTSDAPRRHHTRSIKHERKGHRDAPCACCAPSAFPRTPVETPLPDSTSAPARRACRLSIPGERAFDSLPRPMWRTRRIAFRPLCTHTVHGIRLCSSSALVASSSADRSLSSQTVHRQASTARRERTSHFLSLKSRSPIAFTSTAVTVLYLWMDWQLRRCAWAGQKSRDATTLRPIAFSCSSGSCSSLWLCLSAGRKNSAYPSSKIVTATKDTTKDSKPTSVPKTTTTLSALRLRCALEVFDVRSVERGLREAG